MRKYIFHFITLSALAILITSCGPKKQIDLTSTHTTAAKETMAESTKASDSKTESDSTGETSKDSSSQTEKETTKASSAQNVTTSIGTYTSGGISIEYPEISGLNASAVQETVNKKLMDYAKSIVEAYGMDGTKDTTEIRCQVISADRRRITAIYTGTYTAEGAPYPLNIFYTNTMDTTKGNDIGLTDYADPYTLAGYVLSGDCKFYNAEPEVEKALMEMKNQKSLEEYTNLFKRGDFPYKKAKDGSGDEVKFPPVFSYEKDGTIYISIPVDHALGDFALIQYTPEGK